MGIDFIICDHHLPDNKIPKAVAVLDPKREDCSYPFKELCGCGIGFKLIQALQMHLGLPDSELSSYLDLVAIAIRCRHCTHDWGKQNSNFSRDTPISRISSSGAQFFSKNFETPTKRYRFSFCYCS